MNHVIHWIVSFLHVMKGWCHYTYFPIWGGVSYAKRATRLFIHEQIPPNTRPSSFRSQSLILHCIEAIRKDCTRFDTVAQSARYNLRKAR